jgi:Rrf2 family nitric oxide-sensitive transcriptional repressor
MRLTRFTDNALRCLVYLAANPDRTITVAEVADRMGMSQDHLLKVVQRLADLGWVGTQRGRHGGVRLATPPQEIRVADVVRSTEENLTLVPCIEPGRVICPVASCCVLPAVFDEALQAFFGALEQYTIADLVIAGTPCSATSAAVAEAATGAAAIQGAIPGHNR